MKKFITIIIAIVGVILLATTLYFPLSPVSLSKSIDIKLHGASHLAEDVERFEQKYRTHKDENVAAKAAIILQMFDQPLLVGEDEVKLDDEKLEQLTRDIDVAIFDMMQVVENETLPHEVRTYANDFIHDMEMNKDRIHQLQNHHWATKKSLHVQLNNLQNDLHHSFRLSTVFIETYVLIY